MIGEWGEDTFPYFTVHVNIPHTFICTSETFTRLFAMSASYPSTGEIESNVLINLDEQRKLTRAGLEPATSGLTCRGSTN